MQISSKLNFRLVRMRYGTYGEILVFRFFEWLIIGLGGTFMGFFIVLPLIMIGAGIV